jgi:site-specific DNA-methyltransferase (adenine-specific)
MGKFDITAPATNEAKQWDGWGTALKPAHEPIVMARKPLDGTVANNVLTHGVGGINIDGCRVGEGTGETKTVQYPDIRGNNYNNASGTVEYTITSQGRFPANFIHDGSDEVLELFPESKSPAIVTRGAGGQHGKYSPIGRQEDMPCYGDNGSAARFFYCAKASKKDRNEGLDGFEEKQTTGGGGLTADFRDDGSLETASAGGKYGSIKAKQTNHHPTVKPTPLMRYLCRLITPPGGVIFDGFMGSGSTGKAAVLEGFRFVGAEINRDYATIARARVKHASANLQSPAQVPA